MHSIKTVLFIAALAFLVGFASARYTSPTKLVTDGVSIKPPSSYKPSTETDLIEPPCTRYTDSVKIPIEPTPIERDSEPDQPKTWAAFAENFNPEQLRQQVRSAKAQLRQAAKQTHSSEQLLSIANKLKSLNDEPLDTALATKLLDHIENLNEEEQLDALSLMQDALTLDQLTSLQSFFFSYHSEIREEAFLRLQELGVTEDTLPHFEQFTDPHLYPKWLTSQATAMIIEAHGQ